MLFQTKYHSRLRDGAIDLTFRRWAKPQVKVDGRYRFDAGSGVLVVTSIGTTTVGKITARDAKRAGFDTVEELVKALDRGKGSQSTSRTPVHRVAFRFEQEERPAPKPATAANADDCVTRLQRMDDLSRRGRWTREVLELIAANPRVAASKLATRLDRETRPFKADVRKLKTLGLTVSHETGYDLTLLGRRVLAKP